MAEQSVTLNPGESKAVSFEAIPHEAKTYQVSVDGLSSSFKVIAAPLATLYGVVKDASTGAALVGANVSLWSPDGGEFLLQTTTDSGNYRMENILPDNYMVVFRKDGYAIVTKSVALKEGLNELNISLEPVAAMEVLERYSDVEVTAFAPNTVNNSVLQGGVYYVTATTGKYGFPLIRVRFNRYFSPVPTNGQWAFYPDILPVPPGRYVACPIWSAWTDCSEKYAGLSILPDKECGPIREANTFYGYGDVYKEPYCGEPVVAALQAGTYYRSFYMTHRYGESYGYPPGAYSRYKVIPVGTYDLHLKGMLYLAGGTVYDPVTGEPLPEFERIYSDILIAKIRINQELPLW